MGKKSQESPYLIKCVSMTTLQLIHLNSGHRCAPVRTAPHRTRDFCLFRRTAPHRTGVFKIQAGTAPHRTSVFKSQAGTAPHRTRKIFENLEPCWSVSHYCSRATRVECRFSTKYSVLSSNPPSVSGGGAKCTKGVREETLQLPIRSSHLPFFIRLIYSHFVMVQE